MAETEYMLGIAGTTDFIAKVVGWIDFENREDVKHLQRLAKHHKFSGVRLMIQDIADPNWMHRPSVQWAYDAIIDLDLTFDALGFPLHIEEFQRLFDRYPKMRSVINHCMKPKIRVKAFEDWARVSLHLRTPRQHGANFLAWRLKHRKVGHSKRCAPMHAM